VAASRSWARASAWRTRAGAVPPSTSWQPSTASNLRLARSSGVSKATLSGLERGSGNPSVDTVWALARALLSNDPALAEPAQSRLPFLANPTPASPAALPQPPAVLPAGAAPGYELALAAPPRGTSPIVLELSAFARAVDRRWLDPELLGIRHGRLRALDALPDDLLPSWIAALRERRPAHADEEQWLVKLDLLRSAALVLRPHPDALRLATLPESGRVPALFFALLYDRGKRDLLGELGEQLLAAALAHSLACIPNRPWRRTRRLLEEWKQETRLKRPRISEQITQALAARPPALPVL